MSELEKNIRENRFELDHIEMPETGRIWEKIQRGMELENQSPSAGWDISIGKYWRWTIAASICLIVGAFFLLRPSLDKTDASIDLASYYPELAQQKEQYVQLIKQKEAEVNINQINRNNFIDIFKELEMLDNIHQETLEDVPKYIDNEQLVRTLIRYYEQKIRILERLSKEVSKQEYHEEKNRERSL